MRAFTTGSLGTAKGSLSMITQLNCSPGTSTPCQKDDVAKSTQLGVARNSSSSALRGPVPCISVGPPSHGGGRQSSFDRAERKIAQGREILQAVLLAIERHKRTPSATGKQGAVIVDGVRSRREDDIACLRRENQFIDADGRKAGGEVAGTKTEDTTTLTGPFARPEARAVNYVKNMANVDLG